VGDIHINRGRVGEERRGKEMDGCPLIACASYGYTLNKGTHSKHGMEVQV
jgi:hypothetical protein